MRKLVYIVSILLSLLVDKLWAQGDTSNVNAFILEVKEDMLNLPVEGLQDKKVYSVSKKIENWVSTPLSVEVITQEEIVRSGVISIPEALRLAPGVIVRQRTNGTFDVHIRGLDNINQDGYLRDTENQAILVLIDEVPYYDYLRGTVFWESLPVDLHDIERIEIVKTPHQAFFGTNAAGGFIHIITRKVEENGLRVNGSIEGGNNTTAVDKIAVSYGVNDQLRFRLSGNYHFANRFQDDVYLLNSSRYVSPDSLLFHKIAAESTNLNTDLGNQQYAINFTGVWDINNNIQLQSFFSNQHSRAQTVFVDDTLAMATRLSNTNTLSFISNIYNAHVQLSYRFGNQDNALGFPGMKFDINHFKINADYNFQYNNLTITPGLHYQRIAYDDTPYIGDTSETAIFNRKVTLTDFAAYLRLDWAYQEHWRVIAALRNDSYNILNTNYPSYQLAASYRINNDHLIRFSTGRGNQTPLFNDFYNNASERFPEDGVTRSRFREDNLKLTKVTSYELGYRAKFLRKIETDIELFYLRSGNYLKDVLEDNLVTRMNADLGARQFGLSIQAQTFIAKMLVRGFITFQYSRIVDLMDEAGNLTDINHKATPNIYGGLELDYSTLFDKLNINTNIYFFDNQEFVTRYGTDSIKSKLLLNLKISYKFWKENQVYVNLRNAPGLSSREFAFAE